MYDIRFYFRDAKTLSINYSLYIFLIIEFSFFYISKFHSFDVNLYELQLEIF
jgi:hypothetical protein